MSIVGARRIMMKKRLGKFLLTVCFHPYQTWSNGNQENKLQILKYSNQLLEKGGRFSSDGSEEISDRQHHLPFFNLGQELVVSNILDTNNPYEVTRMPLSWPTDRFT